MLETIMMPRNLERLGELLPKSNYSEDKVPEKGSDFLENGQRGLNGSTCRS
jgi:hypothetical protein